MSCHFWKTAEFQNFSIEYMSIFVTNAGLSKWSNKSQWECKYIRGWLVASMKLTQLQQSNIIRYTGRLKKKVGGVQKIPPRFLGPCKVEIRWQYLSQKSSKQFNLIWDLVELKIKEMLPYSEVFYCSPSSEAKDLGETL